jgi:ABC-2 type transport system permease protein
MTFGGSVLFGVAVGVAGLFFAAVAAVFSQLSYSSRGAMGLSFLALGVLYLVRGIGDVSSEALALSSALGLVLRSQVYVGNYIWPPLLILAQVALLAAVAYALNAKRDMDQGFIPAKPGKSEASKALGSSFGLSFRLLRNMLIVWLIVMFALGASYGTVVGGDIEAFIENNEFYRDIIGTNDNFSTALMFTTMVNAVGALICVVPVLVAAMKPRSEESDHRTEHILSRSVSRIKYLRGYVSIAFVSSVLFQLATPVGLYSMISSANLDETIPFSDLLAANLVYLPALWVMIGAAVLLIGLLPKMMALIWGYYGLSFFTAFIGRMMNLPEWLNRITPFTYIPQIPVDEINYLTLGGLTVVAAGLTAVGFIGYHKRDTITV